MSEIKPKRERGTGRLFLRGATWWAQYYSHGHAIRVSTKYTDEKKAERFLRGKIGEVEAGIAAPVGARHLKYDDLRDALIADYQVRGRKWLRVGKDGKPYLADLAHVSDYFEGWKVADIGTDALRKFIAERQRAGAANGTINRGLALLRRAFSLAVKESKLRGSDMPFFPTLKEAKPRKGFLEHADYLKLRAELPEYLRPVAALGYHSGMRKSEILGLKWPNVDFLASEIHLTDTKNGESRTVPMVAEVLEMLKTEHQRKKSQFVFTNDGHAIGSFFKAWKSAAKRAGVPDLLFHDLRRSGIRNLVRAGVSEKVCMTISGHRTRSVFDRYNVTSGRDLADAAGKLESYLEKFGHNSGTIAPSREGQAVGDKEEVVAVQ